MMVFVAIITKNNLLGTKKVRGALIIRGIVGSIVILYAYFSVKLIDPSESTALLSFSMIITPILARFLIKKKFPIFNILPLTMSLIGVFFIAQPSVLFNKRSLFTNFNNCSFNLTDCDHFSSNENNQFKRILGILFGLITAFSSAFVLVSMENLKNKKVHFSIISAYVLYFGIPISFLISLVTYITDGQKHDMTLINDLPSILYQIGFATMAGVASVLSQVAINFALKHEDSSKVAIIRSTSVLYAFLFQYLFLPM